MMQYRTHTFSDESGLLGLGGGPSRRQIKTIIHGHLGCVRFVHSRIIRHVMSALPPIPANIAEMYVLLYLTLDSA